MYVDETEGGSWRKAAVRGFVYMTKGAAGLSRRPLRSYAALFANRLRAHLVDGDLGDVLLLDHLGNRDGQHAVGEASGQALARGVLEVDAAGRAVGGELLLEEVLVLVLFALFDLDGVERRPSLSSTSMSSLVRR